MCSTVCWWRDEGTKHLVVFANENHSVLINSVLNAGESQPDYIIFLIHQQNRSLAITCPPHSTSAICGESFRVRNNLKNCCFRSEHARLHRSHLQLETWRRAIRPSICPFPLFSWTAIISPPFFFTSILRLLPVTLTGWQWVSRSASASHSRALCHNGAC